MHFIDRFSDRADLYASARPTYPDRLFELLAAHCANRELAWECGAGSGQATVPLARRFRHVYATDPSAEQLRNARRTENVEYAIGVAESVELGDSTVDLVVAAQALHWFNRERFYGEVQRVLRPGGIVAVIGYDWFYVSPEVDSVVADSILSPIRSFWAPQNAIVWDGYRAIEFPFAEIRLPPIAIHLTWTLAQLLDYIATWSATRAATRATGDGFLREASARLLDVWGDPSAPKAVTLPLHVRVGRTHSSRG